MLAVAIATSAIAMLFFGNEERARREEDFRALHGTFLGKQSVFKSVHERKTEFEGQSCLDTNTENSQTEQQTIAVTIGFTSFLCMVAFFKIFLYIQKWVVN